MELTEIRLGGTDRIDVVQHEAHRPSPVHMAIYVGVEVLTIVVMKGSIFCDIMACSPLKVS
jgi:hypothetical protein